jgi:glycolate oxidase FAD binding subunit
MKDRDASAELCAQVQDHYQRKTPLRIVAGQSKAFYGNPVSAAAIDVNDHCGIVHYEPSELVLTARCGTPLKQIEQTLAEHNQILGYEPPHFGETATFGGSIASGLSGPARPFRGAARDFVLGMRMINGKGEDLHFGGEVMKNVAGYDLARLLTGSLGTLGVILEISIKVLPMPEQEQTVSFESNERDAIQRMNELSARPLPLTAACYDGERIFLRLSGNNAAVSSARKQIGGDLVTNATQFWRNLREQQHRFFDSRYPLWRLSLTPAHPPLEFSGKQFIDWGGAQRWLVSEEQPGRIRERLAALQGHASIFRHGGAEPVFHPLSTALHKLHRNLKFALDPHGVFNPGRMYPEL